MKDYQPDNRRTKRYMVSGKAFLVHPKSICQITNISSEGLSFICLSEKKIKEELTVDILFINSKFHIKEVPAKITWERRCKLPDFALIPTREFGAKFTNLDSNQQLQIDNLINHHTQEQM